MTDDEINAIAEGTFTYLQGQCGNPPDTLSVITCILLMFYAAAKSPVSDYSIENFAGDLSDDLTAQWKRQAMELQ